MNKKKRYTYHFDLLPNPLIQDQLQILFRFGVVYFWTQVFSASLLAGLLWFSYPINQWLIGIWYTAIIGLSASRWWTSVKLGRDMPHTREQIQQWAQRYLILTTMLSTLWGVSSVILFVSDLPILTLHIVLLTLISLSALPVLLLARSALYIQIVALFVPSILILLLQSTPILRLLGIGLIGLAGMLAFTGYLLAIVLDNLQTAQLRMLEQMHTDPVTQLANRRYFEQVFKLEWRRSARASESLSLLMIDVDQFKHFNDQYGHQAGDQCLQMIARTLRMVVQRAADVVARHGGEEFVVLLPQTELAAALKVAEQLRQQVEQQSLTQSSGVATIMGKSATISIGVSACIPSVIRDEGSQAETEREILFPAMLLHAADRALYRAKRNGRNQVAFEYCGTEVLEKQTLRPHTLTQAA